jgi:hypothetical protein
MAYGPMLGALTTTTLASPGAHPRPNHRRPRRRRTLRAAAIAALQLARVAR